MTKQIPIPSITLIQLREQTDHSHVEDLAVAMIDPNHRNEIPAIECLTDGGAVWCWDGIHRILAAKQAGLSKVRANVEPGTEREAILKAAGANVKHGLRRTFADKRKAVGALLADDEWRGRSDRWIAEQCSVSATFVADVKKSTGFQVQATTPESVEGKDGKRYKRRKHDLPDPKDFPDPTPPALEPAEHAPADATPTGAPCKSSRVGASHKERTDAADSQDGITDDTDGRDEDDAETDKQERTQEAGHEALYFDLANVVMAWRLRAAVSTIAVASMLDRLRAEYMEGA